MTSAVQPCDFCSSWVSSNIFVFSQPTTSPPPLLVHSVWLASWANCRWCVPKQVSMRVNCLLLGSYMASCRPLLFSGNSFADGWLDPGLQNAGLSSGRTTDVNHTRPFSSNIGLCMLAWLSQIDSSAQYGEGFNGFGGLGVFGSRTGIFTWLAVWRTGSRMGTLSVLSSGAP